jgi:molybdopterin-guanine dinucleotide biosynthesis protein A
MGGVDKTAIELDGVAIVERVKRALRAACDHVVVVGREAGGGPAAAVASAVGALEVEPHDIVVVVAGDLALLRADHVRALVEALSDHDAAAAVDSRGLPNPLVAAYGAAALGPRLADIAPGDRADRLLSDDTILVRLDADATFNVNTPDDLDEARRRLSR